MKFLVILICLLINHYWQKERGFPAESWFGSFQRSLRAGIARLPAPFNNHVLVYPILLLLIPVLSAWLLLMFAEGLLLGFVTLALHILILLLALDRLNMVLLSEEYLLRLRRGDWAAASLLIDTAAGERAEPRTTVHAGSAEQVHAQYRDLLLGSYFERLFTVVFLYLLAGPAAVLVYLILRLYRADEGMPASPSWPDAAEPRTLSARLVYLLEWIPARLLALSFALAGDFEGAFAQLRRRFFSAVSGALIVTETASAAVHAPAARAVLLEEGIEEEALPLSPAISEARSWLALMVRCQVIWLAGIALLTLYGYAV
jgi:AmpE protein